MRLNCSFCARFSLTDIDHLRTRAELIQFLIRATICLHCKYNVCKKPAVAKTLRNYWIDFEAMLLKAGVDRRTLAQRVRILTSKRVFVFLDRLFILDGVASWTEVSPILIDPVWLTKPVGFLGTISGGNRLICSYKLNWTLTTIRGIQNGALKSEWALEHTLSRDEWSLQFSPFIDFNASFKLQI